MMRSLAVYLLESHGSGWDPHVVANGVLLLTVLGLLLYVIRQRTAQKRTEQVLRRRTEELQQAYSRLDSHLTNTPLAVVEWDHDFRVSLWTGQAASIFGWEAQEVMGRNPNEWDFVHPDDQAEVNQVMAYLLEGGARNISYNRNFSADGRVLECEWFNSVRRDRDGKLISIFSLAQDVTERNRAQRELAQLNARLRQRADRFSEEAENQRSILQTVLNSLQEGVVALGRENELLVKNRASECMLGETSLKTLSALAADEESTVWIEDTQRWIDLSTNPLRNTEGRLFTVRDVTEQRRYEEQLRESESRFRGAFRASAVGMAIVSREGQFVDVNDSLCRIVGYTREELIELTFQDITHPDDLEKDLELLKELTAGKIPYYHLEKRYFHKGGGEVWIRLSASAVRDSEKNILYYLAQIEDVTPERKARRALESSLQEKELLLREVHHRVKNNLQVVTSLLQLQERRLDDESVAGPLAESRRRVRAMALVHESLYRSEDLAQVDMRGYLERLCQPLSSEPDQIVVQAEASLPMIRAVPCGLIINELVSNSVKHAGEAGPISVSLVDKKKVVELRVDDQGEGFPAEPLTKDTLGLRLVEALVDQLDGELEYLPGPGGHVRVTFPPNDNGEGHVS